MNDEDTLRFESDDDDVYRCSVCGYKYDGNAQCTRTFACWGVDEDEDEDEDEDDDQRSRSPGMGRRPPASPRTQVLTDVATETRTFGVNDIVPETVRQLQTGDSVQLLRLKCTDQTGTIMRYIVLNEDAAAVGTMPRTLNLIAEEQRWWELSWKVADAASSVAGADFGLAKDLYHCAIVSA